MFSSSLFNKNADKYIVFMTTSISQAALDELSNAIALCKHISALQYVLVIFQLAQRSSEARRYFIIELKHVQRERVRAGAMEKFPNENFSATFHNELGRDAMPARCFLSRFRVPDKTLPR